MNLNKKDGNGWVLCPSTRFLGKLYFFNPATGQAVWNLSDMERIMSSRPTITNSEKWYTYPEPDSPPDTPVSWWAPDTPTSWGFQPDIRAYQTMNPFSQPPYQNYSSNAMEANPHSMWGMPHPMYIRPGMMNVPQFEPMGQMWPNYGHGSKHFMPENNFYPNPYMHKIPGYSQDMNRYVYGPKPNRNVPVFMGNNIGNKQFTKKRRMSMESVNLKEPLFKRLRSQNDFQSDNMFRPKDSVYPTRSFESLVPEKVCKPCKTSAFPENNSNENVCKCMRSKSQENLSRMLSKSQGNLGDLTGNARDPFEFSNKEHMRPIPNMRLSSSKSMDNLTAISPSEISSNFSLKNSFIFPLRKSARSKSFDLPSEISSKKNELSSDAAQFGQETKRRELVGENSDNNLSECDLRYVLLERRRKSSLHDRQETEKEKAKKIKTSYTKDDKARENCNKKRVTFDLGVEDSAVDDQDDDNPLTDGCAGATEPNADELVQTSYLIPDTEALMKDFETLEELIKLEPSYTLFISSTVRRDIEAASGQSAGGARGGARRRVTAARHIARRLAPRTGILVQALDPPRAVESTSDPLLACCLQVYEEGNIPILVCDNQTLLSKAQDLKIECYQTEDVKQYLDKLKTAVSFNVEKTDEDVTPIVPTTVFRRQLFPKDNSDQFFLDEEKATTQTNNKPDRSASRANQESFFGKNLDMLRETRKEIENLNLQENIVGIRKNQDTPTSNKQHSEQENANLFNKNDEAVEDNITAKKKNKSINVYNLDGHLKSFSIKTKDIEEAIRTKMDEYFCCFSQIMETVFLDISKDMPMPGCETSLTPLQSSLHYMRVIFADHRTATLLIDKLGAMLDQAHTLINGRLMLNVEPHEFLKMFGCGTLLVSVLKSILPSEGCLEEGSRLLLQLERRLEGGEREEGGESPVPPATPAPAREDRKQEHVKKPGEVLQFLTQHYHDWRQQAHTHTTDEVDVSSNLKVVRTTGRDVGLLRLDPKKLITLNDNDDRSCDDHQEITKDKELNNKAKLIKKLAVESLNLPPKMKAIDVEKREKINKECTEMLEQMVTCRVPQRPVTRFYNLRSIIVKDNADSSKKTDSRNKTTRSDKQEPRSNSTIDSTTSIVEAENVLENSKEHSNNNQQWATREPYNLDAVDYSEMQESGNTNDKDSTRESSSNKNLVESDNSNHVTTTQRGNENDEASPNTGSNNYIYTSNETSDKINEVDAKNAKNDVDQSAENYDSGIESEQAQGFVQHFLANLSSTFLTIKQFIESSASELRSKSDARSKNRIQRKAETARAIVSRIIDNLDFISERESSPGTIVTPLLVRGLSPNDSDTTITKYRLMISKCAASAHALRDALRALAALAQAHDSR